MAIVISPTEDFIIPYQLKDYTDPDLYEAASYEYNSELRELEIAAEIRRRKHLVFQALKELVPVSTQ